MEAARHALTRLALAAALLPVACGPRRGGPTVAAAPLARRLLAVGAELGVARSADGQGEVDDGARSLERLAARAQAALAAREPGSPIDAVNAAVFDEAGFRREVDDTDLAYVLLPSVLRERRGSCVGLGTLELALAELVGVRARGVVVPGHFFVRVDEGGRARNVELLRRGEDEPAAWYHARWPLPATTVPTYDRALTDDEVVGVVEYDVGNELRRRGRLAEARHALERAVAHFPSLPEAEASLGAVLQLEGALDAAAVAYEAARRIEPELPGLGRNVRLLETERATR